MCKALIEIRKENVGEKVIKPNQLTTFIDNRKNKRFILRGNFYTCTCSAGVFMMAEFPFRQRNQRSKKKISYTMLELGSHLGGQRSHDFQGRRFVFGTVCLNCQIISFTVYDCTSFSPSCLQISRGFVLYVRVACQLLQPE